jgi:hypothetical protein
MNRSLKPTALTLAGLLTVGVTACSTDLPDEPSAGGAQPDVSILQAPSNDDFANALVITSLRFTDNLNTSEATAVDDPPNDCLVDGHTVWYRFTPTEDMRINANTFGSDYDTGIAVYTGAPPNLTQIACNDDAITGAFVQSNVNFDGVAGTTYYFMVGSCCGSDGGNLVFNVDVSVNLSLTVDPSGSVDTKTGIVTLRGTVSCSEPVTTTVDGSIQQRVGRTLLRSNFFTIIECDGVTPWEVQVFPDNGLFVGGQIQATVNSFAFDRDFTSQSTTVRLKGKGK